MVNDRHADVDRWLIDSATEELSRDPRDLGVLYERAGAYINVGELENAIDDLNTAVQLIDAEQDQEPKALFLTLRAETQELLGNREEAVKDYTEIIGLGDHETSVFFRRAYCYRELGAYQDALNDLDVYIQKEPSDTIALFNRGLVHLALDETTEAFEDFYEVVRRDAKFDGAIRNRGVCQYWRGAYSAAIKDLEETITTHPDDHIALYFRGVSYS